MRLIVAIVAATFVNLWPAAAQTTTHPPYYQNGSFCTLERDVIYSGYSTDRSLQCYCVTKLRDWLAETNAPTRTEERTIGEGATTKTITTHGSKITTTLANVQVETYLNSINGDYADNFNFYGSATSPCCSSCTVAAQTVDLFYFPTPAVKSAATSFVSNGYTYISPSVYIGFTSLYAFDFCGNVGGSYTSTTLEFHPSEISTLGKPVASTETYTQAYEEYTDGTLYGTTTETDTWTMSAGLPTAINFRDLGPGCSSGIAGYTYLASEPFSQLMDYDPCHPVIVLPTRLKTMVDPAWASCANNGLGGFYDPPSALTHVPAPTTQSSPVPTAQPVESPSSSTTPPVITTPPAPASTPDSPIAKPTTTPPVIAPLPTTVPVADPAPVNTPDPVPVNSPKPANPPANTPDPAPANTPTPVQPDPSPNNPVAPPNPVPTSSSSILQPVSATPVVPAVPVVPIISSSSTQTQILPGPVDPPASPSSAPQTPPADPQAPPSPQSPPSLLPSPSPSTTIAVPSAGQVYVSATLQPGGPAVSSGGVLFTIASSASSVVAIVGSQTLIAGGAPITASSTVYSLPSGGGNVIATVVSANPSLGAVIISVMGGLPPSPSVTSVGPGTNTTFGGNSTQTPTFVMASMGTKDRSIFRYCVAGMISLFVGFVVLM